MSNQTQAALQERAVWIMRALRGATRGMVKPAAEQIVADYGRDPYLVLTSCVLSLRTKDTVSLPASRRLFALAMTPYDMVKQSQSALEEAIYPVGFYRRKASQLIAMSQEIIDRFEGEVPCEEHGLLSLKGVGRKTMALVLGEGFGVPAICVDVHVHRISNRLGLVKTKTPHETEAELKKILLPEYWVEFNRLIVMWGQNICVPQSPRCSQCVLAKVCPKVEVTRSR